MKKSKVRLFFKAWLSSLLLLVISAVAGSMLLRQLLSDFIFSFFLLPVIIGFVYFIYSKWNDFSNSTYIRLLFWWSLFIRICSIFAFDSILTSYIGMPFLSFKDDYIYNLVAQEIAERWRTSGIGFYEDILYSTGSYSGFPNFSAILMYIGGDSYLFPRFGNAVLSAFSCVTAYKICRSYADQDKSRFVGLIFMFSPLLITFSSLQVKDILLLFLCLVAIHASIKILKGEIFLTTIAQFTVALWGMVFIRPAAMVPIVAAFIVTLMYSSIHHDSRKIVIKTVVLIVILAGVFYSWNKISEISGGNNSDDYFTSRYDSMTTREIGNTDAGINKTSLAKIAGTPLYLLLSLFLPPPMIVELSGEETINYASWGILFHLSLLPFLCVGLFRSIKYRREMIIPFYLALLFLFFKVGQASSVMSIFSPRQSLSTIFVMYLMLPMCGFDTLNNKKSRLIIMLISILIMYSYAVVRLYTRGLV